MSMRTRSITIVVAATVAALLPGASARAASPDVLISQVYGGGGDAAVDLTGWSVQYASAAGTSWQVTALSGTIPPHAHYLVQEAAGSGGTTPLPTPDATGSINMSGT